MKKFWYNLANSRLYQFLACSLWAIISYTILWNLGLDFGWWLLIPAIGAIPMVGVILALIIYAWIINPIRTLRERRNR